MLRFYEPSHFAASRPSREAVLLPIPVILREAAKGDFPAGCDGDSRHLQIWRLRV